MPLPAAMPTSPRDDRSSSTPASSRRLYAEKMTISEAAEACHVDYDTFLAWVRKGVIPYVMVGPTNLKRVYRTDVEKLIRDGDTT